MDFTKYNSLNPLEDRVIFKKLEGQDKTHGGLYLPEISQDGLNKGIVIAVGPGVKNHLKPDEIIPTKLKQGDIIYYSTMVGLKFNFESDSELIIQRESEILVLIKESDES